MYTPTQSDLVSVIQLLHNNGIEVSNSKAAYAELKQYESNPSFCILLATVFGSDVIPVPDLTLPVSWVQYRQLAGITLKNNLESARHALGEAAVKEAARFALQSLSNPPDARIARTSAQVIVKITALTSFEWWSASRLGDLADILLNQLLPSGELKTLAALYCLQYLMEDLPKQIGAASEHVILKVSDIALSQSLPILIRKAAFRMCFNIYEQASLLEWNVDTFSPLQEGLSKASCSFSLVCASLIERSCEGDSAFTILVLRSCAFLLDYFDFFLPISPSDMQRYANGWINNSVNLICSNQNLNNGNQELVAAAIDLISTAVDLYDRNGGETAIDFLVTGIPQAIPSLAPALVRYSLLSPEEVANILDTDDYRIRDTTAVSFEVKGGTKDISEDDMLDEDAAAMTLRSSALKCMDTLSRFSSDATFQALIGPIQQLWTSNDWREREAGIVLVGTIAKGCTAELNTVLPALVEQFVQFISNESEHICVVSIAAWSLSRLSESILNSSPETMNRIIPLLSSRLQSTSKRIQITSVSALNIVINILETYGSTDIIIAHFPVLLETAYSCLPVYSTTNLSLLIDLVSKLIPFMKDQAEVARLSSVLQTERVRRAASFEESYTAMYVREESNVLVDKDIFSLDRGIIAFLITYPNNEVAIANLENWNEVLRDIRNRNVVDDADLVFNTLLICSAYASSVSTVILSEWLKSKEWALTTSAVHFLTTSKTKEIKVAAITTICILLRTLGTAALPSHMYDPLLKWSSSEVVETEDLPLKEVVVRLISQAVLHYPETRSEIAMEALRNANSILRTDAFGESLYSYSTMAFDLCAVLKVAPSCASFFRIDLISQLMAQSENTVEKSEATIFLFQAIVGMQRESLAGVLPFAMKVVYSWQQAALNHPETASAIRSLLLHAMKECPKLFQTIFQSLPASLRDMLVLCYRLR